MENELNPAVQKMIETLDGEVGYTEKSNGYTKFGDWYEKNVDDSYGFANAAWCDMFLAWGAAEVGLEESFGQFAYTPAHAAWFRKQDAWGKEPKPGALVFYDWSGSDNIGNIDHVGIVTKVEGDRIQTLEGNVDGRFVKRKERDQGNVVGYGYPDQVKTAEQAEPEPPEYLESPEESDSGIAPPPGDRGVDAPDGGVVSGTALAATALPQTDGAMEASALLIPLVLAVAAGLYARRKVAAARAAGRPRGRHHLRREAEPNGGRHRRGLAFA